jgi:hypothetical protein
MPRTPRNAWCVHRAITALIPVVTGIPAGADGGGAVLPGRAQVRDVALAGVPVSRDLICHCPAYLAGSASCPVWCSRCLQAVLAGSAGAQPSSPQESLQPAPGHRVAGQKSHGAISAPAHSVLALTKNSPATISECEWTPAMADILFEQCMAVGAQCSTAMQQSLAVGLGYCMGTTRLVRVTTF